MFKIIKNLNWIILSSFLCLFIGILTFFTFINEGPINLTDNNLPDLVEDVDITNGEFGSEYTGKQRLWYFKFTIEQEDALSVDFLKDDFDLVPVIAGLTETITINNNAFRLFLNILTSI